MADRLPAREAKRLQTRERLLGAAVAEFRRTGVDAADISAIARAAGVANGTFYFHFPTKEHVMLDLERREEDRLVRQFTRFLNQGADLEATFREALNLVLSLEARLGPTLFKDFLALHFLPSRPQTDTDEHPMVDLLADQIAQARDRGEIAPDVIPANSAVFFLLGLYALLSTTGEWPERDAFLTDYLTRNVRGLSPVRPPAELI